MVDGTRRMRGFMGEAAPALRYFDKMVD